MPNKNSKQSIKNNKRGGQGNNLCALTDEDVVSFQQAVNNLNSAATIITAIFNKCSTATPTDAQQTAAVQQAAVQAAVDQAVAQQVAAVQQPAPAQLPMAMPMPTPTPVPLPGPVSGGNRKLRKNNKK